jgi:peptidoglycan hydrolase CwlO-like protein
VTSTSPRRRLVIATLAVAFLAALLFTATASASPIARKKARLKAVQARLETVYTQTEVANERLNQATSQLATVQQKIRQNTRLLESARRNYRRANRHLEQRAVNIYKSRDAGVLDWIFRATSFDDLVTQMDLMTRLGNSDVDTIHSIEKYKRDIRDRRIRLKADRRQADALVERRAAEKAKLLGLQADLESMTRGLKKEIKKLRAKEALRAKLALLGYDGPIPDVDPNSPGHPEIIAIAQRYFGVPYVWGGAGPSGFDCSGLTMYCYAQIGIKMWHGATDQQRASMPVPLGDLRPGDLIFFGNASFSHHVAIFVGGSTCIEAPHTGDVVRYGTWTGRDAWIGGRF